MCTPEPPQISPNSAEAKKPDPAIIRNPYLDNATDFAKARQGRSQLRIDPGTPVSARIPLPPSATPTPGSPRPGPPIRRGETNPSEWGRLAGAVLRARANNARS